MTHAPTDLLRRRFIFGELGDAVLQLLPHGRARQPFRASRFVAPAATAAGPVEPLPLDQWRRRVRWIASPHTRSQFAHAKQSRSKQVRSAGGSDACDALVWLVASLGGYDGWNS